MLHRPQSLARVISGAETLRILASTALLVGTANAQTFGPRTVLPSIVDGPTCVEAGDLNGDGVMDLVVAEAGGGRVTWIPQLPGGGFGQVLVIDGNLPDASRVRPVDVDGDLDMDVVAGSTMKDTLAWYENGGDGSTWTKHVLVAALNGFSSLAMSDVNMDGDLDLLVTSYADDKVSLFENGGKGGFEAQVALTTKVDNAKAIEPADINADGSPDILVSGVQLFSTDSLNKLVNQGDGTFGPLMVIATASMGITSMSACDLDDDGDLDLLATIKNKVSLAWFENDGTGGFSSYQTIFGQVDAHQIRVADVNHDGDLDLFGASVLASFADSMFWHEGQGGGDFEPKITLQDGSVGTDYFALVDIDGDGGIDIVTASRAADAISVFTNQLSQPPALTGVTGKHCLDSGLITITGTDLTGASVKVRGEPVEVVEASPTELTIFVEPSLPGGLCDVELTNEMGTSVFPAVLPRYPVVVCEPAIELGSPIAIDIENGDAGVFILAFSPSLYATPAPFPVQDWYYGLELNGVWFLGAGAFTPEVTNSTVTLPGIADPEFIGTPFYFQAWTYQAGLNYAGFSGVATSSISSGPLP